MAKPIIIEGTLADIDGVRHGQILIEKGIIAAVGSNLGQPTRIFGENCLIFAGMGDIHIHAREDVTGQDTHKETFATAAAAALHGGVIHVADMPNNPAAPIDDVSYAAKEDLVAGVPVLQDPREPAISLGPGVPGLRPRAHGPASSSRSMPASGPARSR